MMSKNNGIPQSRRHYTKPRIEEVKLVAEEAVLQACKTPGQGAGGPTRSNCKLPGNVPCSALGS
jgi:hypothetical protein